tara:strand:+ start:1113 stop:1340 length:228 start_codon:yes stop_codon:yes gene_type:complete
MNSNNILSEGFFDTLRKYLVQYPALKKNKKLKSDLKNLNSSIKKIEDLMNKERQKINPKAKKAKIYNFKLSDFVK